MSFDLYNKYLDGIVVSVAGSVTLIYQGKIPKAGFVRVIVGVLGISEGTYTYTEDQKPRAMNGGDVAASQTMNECITNLAEINAEDEGINAELLMDNPYIKEAGVGFVATRGQEMMMLTLMGPHPESPHLPAQCTVH